MTKRFFTNLTPLLRADIKDLADSFLKILSEYKINSLRDIESHAGTKLQVPRSTDRIEFHPYENDIFPEFDLIIYDRPRSAALITLLFNTEKNCSYVATKLMEILPEYNLIDRDDIGNILQGKHVGTCAFHNPLRELRELSEMQV